MMPEIKKKIIVFASVLKPVDDTRMFEKMGQSLALTSKYEIHIFGYPAKATSTSGITLHSSKPFKRLSLSRLIQPLQIFGGMLRLKPEFVIITSHELLGISILIKLILKCRVIYDIQENYYLNILYTNAFPQWIRPILAAYIRLKEIVLSPFINSFILAEKGYAVELNFTKKKAIVIENKLKRQAVTYTKKSNTDHLIHILFSGTLAETTGVFNAINLAKSLRLLEPTIRLTIIGHCSKHSTLLKIKNEIDKSDFIQLIGGDTLIPHQEIIKQSLQSDFGIISYPTNKSTENRIPTKLYEYLGCKLPILLINTKTWIGLCSDYPACIPIDFNKPDIPSILHQMTTTQFYKTEPQHVYWEKEAEQLINLLDQL